MEFLCSICSGEVSSTSSSPLLKFKLVIRKKKENREMLNCVRFLFLSPFFIAESSVECLCVYVVESDKKKNCLNYLNTRLQCDTFNCIIGSDMSK